MTQCRAGVALKVTDLILDFIGVVMAIVSCVVVVVIGGGGGMIQKEPLLL